MATLPWRATPALARAVVVAGVGLVGAVVTGAPELVVLVAPFLVAGALGLLGRPPAATGLRASLAHQRLHEGQGTTTRLLVDDPRGVEQATRVAVPAGYVATVPVTGTACELRDLAADPARGLAPLAVTPRRWGRRRLGQERTALTSAWAGYRVGPVLLDGSELFVLPQPAAYDARAESPQPAGLVGGHRSRLVGSGTELAGIRPFVAGDRLRRINWRVSLRTRELHVVTARAEEDASVLLVVDAVADLGDSGGVDGEASSLDRSVRAAAALADHHVRRGDRVGLRVVGPTGLDVGPGSGVRHLHRLVGALARLRPESRGTVGGPVHLGAWAGSVVYVLSPMLHDGLVTAAATLTRRGVPVVAVDTLPGHPYAEAPTSPEGLAWRMRLLDRAELLRHLAALGCPVVPWRGPGSLDAVLRRLARRAQLPRVGAR